MDRLEATKKMRGDLSPIDGAASNPSAPEARDTAAYAAEDYRQYLRRRFGEGVPEKEVEAFEAVFRVACRHAEHIEAMRVALRAGSAEGQRRKATAYKAVSSGGGGSL